MKEKIKTSFTWDDRETSFCPCDYCKALNDFPICDDGATSSACNYCDYNIILNCLSKNT